MTSFKMMNVRSVDRAIDLLEAAVRAPEPLSLQELSRVLVLPKSSTLNILRTLTTRGLLDFDPATKRYRPGSFMRELVRSERPPSDLRRLVRPRLEQIALRTQEAVFLSALDGDAITYVDKIDCVQPIRYIAEIGTRRPLHCTSVGKLCLAMEKREFLERYIHDVGLVRYTPNTITERRKLDRELARIRRKGVSVSTGECIPHLMGIAAPIVDANGHFLAAINVAGPLFRMQQREAEIAQMVKEAAAATWPSDSAITEWRSRERRGVG